MKVYKISDGDGWNDIYGEKGVINFALDEMNNGNVLDFIDEEATEDECQALNKDDRRVFEISKDRDNMTLEDALFVIKYDGWEVSEYEVE